MVTLFNAVSQQQKTAESADPLLSTKEQKRKSDKSVQSLSKSGFLDLLRGNNKDATKQKKDTQEAEEDETEKKKTKKAKTSSGWGVFDEDYVNTKATMRDWGRTEDDDGGAAGEREKEAYYDENEIEYEDD